MSESCSSRICTALAHCLDPMAASTALDVALQNTVQFISEHYFGCQYAEHSTVHIRTLLWMSICRTHYSSYQNTALDVNMQNTLHFISEHCFGCQYAEHSTIHMRTLLWMSICRTQYNSYIRTLLWMSICRTQYNSYIRSDCTYRFSSEHNASMFLSQDPFCVFSRFILFYCCCTK